LSTTSVLIRHRQSFPSYHPPRRQGSLSVISRSLPPSSSPSSLLPLPRRETRVRVLVVLTSHLQLVGRLCLCLTLLLTPRVCQHHLLSLTLSIPPLTTLATDHASIDDSSGPSNHQITTTTNYTLPQL
jgi:hypothetical protein